MDFCDYCGWEIHPRETLTVGNLIDPNGDTLKICEECLATAKAEAHKVVRKYSV